MENTKHMENTLASSSGTVSPENQSKTTESKCPFTGGKTGYTNHEWWPNQVDLNVLHQHSELSDPMGRSSTMRKNSRVSI